MQLGIVGTALGSVSWQWVVSYLGSLEPAWLWVKQKSSAEAVGQNMEPEGGSIVWGLNGV